MLQDGFDGPSDLEQGEYDEAYLSPDVSAAIRVCVDFVASAGLVSGKFAEQLRAHLSREVFVELSKNGSLGFVTDEPSVPVEKKELSHVDETLEVLPASPPEISPDNAVTEDSVVCLIDGERKVFMAHYLMTKHGISEEEYKKRFDLPEDFPMVPAAFFYTRSLGKRRRRAVRIVARASEFVREVGSATLLYDLVTTAWERHWMEGRASRNGRRPDWLSTFEELARIEARGFAAGVVPPNYKFSEISREPVVPVSEALGEDYVVCLIDGVKRTMMGPYLRAKYGMSPFDYRLHFGLPDDFPMTAKSYREKKSRLAIDQSLGKAAGRSSQEMPR